MSLEAVKQERMGGAGAVVQGTSAELGQANWKDLCVLSFGAGCERLSTIT